jgi:hypothetical protein
MRPPTRVPGFTTQNEAGPAAAAAHSKPVGDVSLSPRAGSRQLNLRLALGLHQRYRRLLRDCEDEGIDTSMTEIIHALLHQGPDDVRSARQLVRAWRSACGV